MKRISFLVLSFVFLFAGIALASSASMLDRLNMGDLLKIGGGVGGGVLITLLGLLPTFRRLSTQLRIAQEGTLRFIERWKKSPEFAIFKQDFKIVILSYDDVTETLADIAARFRLAKIAGTLRDLIKRQMLDW